jgi:hypothetical protein
LAKTFQSWTIAIEISAAHIKIKLKNWLEPRHQGIDHVQAYLAIYQNIYGSPTNAQNPPLFTLCMHDFTDRWRHRFTVDQFVFKTTLCNVATL